MGIFMEENKKKLILLAVFAAALFLGLKFLLPLAGPFILALFVVCLTGPRLKRLQKKLHIRKELLLGGFLLLAAALVCAILWGLLQAGSVHARELGGTLREGEGQLRILLGDCCGLLEEKFGVDGLEMKAAVLTGLDCFWQDMQENVWPRAARQSWKYAKGLVGALAFLGVGFIASLLLCRDYERLIEKGKDNPLFRLLWQFGSRSIHLVGCYLRAQAVILGAVSLIAGTGLLIGGVKGAVFWGLLAGLLDVLPFIGTGIVLLPAALWQLFAGNIPGTVSVAVSYVLCITARELLEPRLLGSQTGISPVIMLFAVYAGVRLFGLSGIFLGPLYAVLFREGFRMIFTGGSSAQ